MTDLLNVAQTSDDEKYKVLALRGYVRMVGMDSNRPATETIEMYKQVMNLTENQDVRKTVMSGLGNVNDIAALQTAAGYLDDKGLRQEAQAAVIKVAESKVGKDHPEETKAAGEKVLQTTENESLRKQAEKVLKEIK